MSRLGGLIAPARALTRSLLTRPRPGKHRTMMAVGGPLLGVTVVTAGGLGLWYNAGVAAKAKVPSTPYDDVISTPGNIVLYQYSNCPFCSKVRAYLHSTGKEFKIVEVNPITKEETKAVSTYKKVPLLIADGVELRESGVITSILHTHFTSGIPIAEVVELYPAVSTGIEDTNKAAISNPDGDTRRAVYYMFDRIQSVWYSYKKGKETVTYPNKYRIMGYDPEKHEEMLRESTWRKWIDTHFVHLISPNVYRTWGEALAAFDYFTANGNFTDFQKTYIRYIGAGAMYFIGKRLRRRHNLDIDVRSDMYSGVNTWLRALKGKKYHGGSTPNLADIEMYGMCSAFHGMPVWDDVCQYTKIEKWYNRMDRYLSRKSAVGLRPANPTLTGETDLQITDNSVQS